MIRLIGAYGRETSLVDFFNGKDFLIHNGPYCSVRDLERMKKDGICNVEFLKTDYTFVAVFNIDALITLIAKIKGASCQKQN